MFVEKFCTPHPHGDGVLCMQCRQTIYRRQRVCPVFAAMKKQRLFDVIAARVEFREYLKTQQRSQQ